MKIRTSPDDSGTFIIFDTNGLSDFLVDSVKERFLDLSQYIEKELLPHKSALDQAARNY